MTAINIFLKKDRAFLMTDGAFYLPNGDIVGFGNKALPIPNLNASIAVRCLQKVVADFALDFSIRYKSFDDMIDRVSDDLSEWQDLRERDAAFTAWSHVDLYLVGWSESANRPRAFNFQTNNDGGPYAVGELDEIEGWTVGHDPSQEEWFVNLRSIGADMVGDEALKRFDPIRHGIPIMEAQRRTLCDPSDMGSAFEGTKPLSVVGGHVTITEITKEGISQRTVHRWPDQAGVPIVPEPFKRQASSHTTRLANQSNLSRADRRRAEKLGRPNIQTGVKA